MSEGFSQGHVMKLEESSTQFGIHVLACRTHIEASLGLFVTPAAKFSPQLWVLFSSLELTTGAPRSR